MTNTDTGNSMAIIVAVVAVIAIVAIAFLMLNSSASTTEENGNDASIDLPTVNVDTTDGTANSQ